jgi:hypothetical protein
MEAKLFGCSLHSNGSCEPAKSYKVLWDGRIGNPQQSSEVLSIDSSASNGSMLDSHQTPGSRLLWGHLTLDRVEVLFGVECSDDDKIKLVRYHHPQYKGS